ncbi:CAP domain-containing protein [Sphaerisporangium perillae]|uniref:CAP domain-containing protein n=1 Tax=Sphaerisporangium perillae TaxID=2935860 RepID=UPI00201095CC|nr:CAP domain-containing protein [Sphaerisporangium perillae]
MGLLACLTAALLAGAVVVRLNASPTAGEFYLHTGTPTPTQSRLHAAPQPSATSSVGRAPLGHVARPYVSPTAETRPQPTPTATRQRSTIDGSGGELPAATSVGTAGGQDQAAPPDDAPPAGRLEAAAVRLTNQERVQRGCAPLRVDPRLTQSARAHSRDMAAKDYFGHKSPSGLTPWDRMARAGYSNSAAENIARGYQSAEETVRGWMANSGHRRNILNCQIKTVGVGVAYGSGDTWWTQDFGYS